MHILVTGCSGALGSSVVGSLLNDGHSLVAIDRNPIPPQTLAKYQEVHGNRLQTHVIDICEPEAVRRVFRQHLVTGVIHLAAIPSPIGLPPTMVHNVNVTSSYNLLAIACEFGVKRLVQASSVNAVGLAFTPRHLRRFPRLPMNEESEFVEMDPYALSKHICELQARSLCRIWPTVRIASLRFHMIRSTYVQAAIDCHTPSLFCWVSTESAVRACLLGLTSEAWHGAEVFNVVAPRICWSQESVEQDGGSQQSGPCLSTLELIQRDWKELYDDQRVDTSWWAHDSRRGAWDCSKAERILGWVHDADSRPK